MGSSAITRAAVEAGTPAGAGIRRELEGPEQGALFDQEAERAAAAMVPDAGRRWTGKGRKPGAKNRTTKAVIDYCRTRYVDPLMAMGEIVSLGPAGCRQAFGLRPAEAAEFWRKVAADYRRTLYPDTALADALRQASGQGGLAVIGWAAMAQRAPGDAGSSRPDIDGSMSAEDARAATPMAIDTEARPPWEETEKNQGLDDEG